MSFLLVSIGVGTTSACAENTWGAIGWQLDWRNYLRVRGEYLPTLHKRLKHLELPPRARRILTIVVVAHNEFGTTSACAENTTRPVRNKYTDGNYLRVRGEYHLYSIFLLENLELPPRARRILAVSQYVDPKQGTTSACAENTLADRKVAGWKRNYLRVRGEYFRCSLNSWIFMELPPRARRIQTKPETNARIIGTTSACAENTLNELGLL